METKEIYGIDFKVYESGKLEGGEVVHGIVKETGIIEILQIGDKKYNKKEVEEALRDIKSL